ncbi:MAG: hypothetical protein R3F56_25190 [Planctomycetota bacterium]
MNEVTSCVTGALPVGEAAPAASSLADRDTAVPIAASVRTLDLVEALLKQPGQVDQLLAGGGATLELVSRLLAITLVGFTVFGLALTTLMSIADAPLAWLPPVRWADGSALWPILAYDVSVIAACGLCLPSFYFYNVLAGVRIAMTDVVAHAAKCLARSALVLVGILPLWVALVFGELVFGAHVSDLRAGQACGLLLPFFAGLAGVLSLRRGFAVVAERQRQHDDGVVVRAQFLGRLMGAWAAVWTAVTPVMIYTLWTRLAGHPGAALLLGGR